MMCRRRFSILRLLLLFAALSPATAFAHDPFEITADARPRTEGLEVRLTMAWTTCLRAAGDGSLPKPRIPPEEFEQHRARIAKRAAGFFEVTAGDQRLEVRDVRVSLTVEDDAEIVLIFAPPSEGTVRFRAVLLSILPQEGYGSTLTLLARGGAFLGQVTLWADQPVFEIAAESLR